MLHTEWVPDDSILFCYMQKYDLSKQKQIE